MSKNTSRTVGAQSAGKSDEIDGGRRNSKKKKNRSRSRTDLGREIIERRTFGYADGSRKMEK